MIQPHELMEGNYFQWHELASMGRGVDVITPKNHYTYTEFKDPIPLNKEWLIKFGFIQDGFKQFYIKTNHRQEIRITQDFDYVYVIDKPYKIKAIQDMVVVWNKDIKGLIPVHQLQNLYKSLTGEQLTIKE